MINAENITLLLAAYLLGSIPSAVWIGKVFFNTDVREYGSGNAGATNTFRVLGPKAGVPVLLMDIAKGWMAVQLATYFGEYMPATQQFINFKLTLGVAALLGHIFPVFAGFRGGKGVATLLGILWGVNPPAAVICMGVFLLFFLTTGYVSLGSMAAAVSFPFIVMWWLNETVTSMNVFAIAVPILVLVTHQKNIERLLKKTESRVYLFRRKQ
ncbi:MAG: glycerol-3-phosphate 1-O-acyltransferase PlsY [Bacteroidetes bacterium]|jgi:glycerol-3-phosphate acyltransferase PlsY|nr:glycerol-3-phosphate 1-O-acyltransferase PlsY [Bacteroidota bacterium]MBX7239184.1 glycerol-3-phosphate 1-O-acyltransferase PlsY [Bacteroidia bacterium]MCC7513332.1 glycerol-3-phosphate 1-O-acyltransferase PlsY [Bacteroidia bacterium]MCW5918997.1 glycerol-3-phosphate 1-O-acyltransferase PlsY [Bacteroidota bacterium]HMU77165.1 glycerol-3-phosphate 1-O-acyltransferase PlsY [Bacteroidia bacterium]